ncbi:MAG TPA: hypothetical protein VFJ05_04805 [Nitrososphaeraceae archaeon]|nr:hypothetical protein [Nitrososphaeraceae archaeon]
MIRLETWISLGSLVMAIMFVALIISFYSFLVGPDGKGPGIYVDPQGVLIQIISISGAPSLILAGTVFGFQKKYETMHAALILIAAGIILIAGMLVAMTILPKINATYIIAGMDLILYIFIIGGIGVACFGCYLLNKSKRPRQNLEDEIH